jgi:hypothetical protein
MSEEPSWLTVESNGEHSYVRLDLALTTIGRNEGNLVDLADKRLSRFHCEIARRGGAYFVHDCGSRNGTRVNGELITEEHALVDGDRIEMGDTRLVFHVDRPADVGSHDHLIPIRPVGRAFREAGTARMQPNDVDSAEDLTPFEAFDPRPTLAVPAATPRVSVFVLEKWRRLLEAIRLVGETPAAQVAARLVESALDLVPARQAIAIFPASAPGGPHRVLAVRPQPSRGAPLEARFSSGIVDEVLEEGRPISVEDLRSSPWADDVSVLGLGLNGALALPLRAHGRTLAVLYVDDPALLPALEREDALAFLAALAGAAGAVLARGDPILPGSEERDSARALERARAALPPASKLEVACSLVPARGAFVEVEQLPERAGRRELAVLVGLAAGPGRDAGRLEAAARAAFRGLARSIASGSVLLSALEDAIRPELEGRTLDLAILRLDPIASELHVACAGLGPLVHRRAAGGATADGGAGASLGASAGGWTERVVPWGPGDLVLVAAPGSAGLQAASWIGVSPGLGARATLDRLVSEHGRELGAAFALSRPGS